MNPSPTPPHRSCFRGKAFCHWMWNEDSFSQRFKQEFVPHTHSSNIFRLHWLLVSVGTILCHWKCLLLRIQFHINTYCIHMGYLLKLKALFDIVIWCQKDLCDSSWDGGWYVCGGGVGKEHHSSLYPSASHLVCAGRQKGYFRQQKKCVWFYLL